MMCERLNFYERIGQQTFKALGVFDDEAKGNYGKGSFKRFMVGYLSELEGASHLMEDSRLMSIHARMSTIKNETDKKIIRKIVLDCRAEISKIIKGML